MAVTNITYGTKTAITIDFANVATSSTLTAGVESNEISNASNLFDYVLVQVKVSPGTTPTSGKSILIYVWGSDVSLATTALAVLDGTASAETITNEGVRNAFLKLGAAVTLTATTSNQEHPVGPFSVASLFGSMPKFWGLFITHDTAVNSYNNAVNTNAFNYTGITYTTA